jgi:hypothetical protein
LLSVAFQTCEDGGDPGFALGFVVVAGRHGRQETSSYTVTPDRRIETVARWFHCVKDGPLEVS